jgi:hypothetical protein
VGAAVADPAAGAGDGGGEDDGMEVVVAGWRARGFGGADAAGPVAD